jgi:hypothetical protein
MRKHLAILFVAMLSFSFQQPVHAADHQNAHVTVAWNPKMLHLNSNTYFEQEITPLATNSIKDGVPDRWSNQYHVDFCWGSTIANDPNFRCGFVGFGLYSKYGDTYYGNLDFNLFQGIEFRKSDSQVACANNGDAGSVPGIKVNHLGCWRRVPIKMNSKYVLRVQQTGSPAENWWSASLIDKATGQVFTVGDIKAAANNVSAPLVRVENIIYYTGDQVACDAVPIMDTRLGSPRDNSGHTGTYQSFAKLSCVQASIHTTTDQSNDYVLRFGGADPSSRDFGSAVGNLRIPRPNSGWSRPAGLLQGLSEVTYAGYFADNTGFFTDSAVRTKISRTASGQLPIWKDSTGIGSNVSIWWGGYFIPDTTGTWQFNVTSDDASYMWIGNNAVSNYGNGAYTAFIGLPGDHPPISKSNSIYLEKDKIYPLRIQYGNIGTYGSFSLQVKSPDYQDVWDSNLEGLIWSSDFTNREDCTNYGISYSLASKLGYDTINVPGCINNPANEQSQKLPAKSESKPSVKSVEINGNIINLVVNLGDSIPDSVYLLSPSLGLTTPRVAYGQIKGNLASWSIKFNSALLGSIAKIKMVSNSNGIDSESLSTDVTLPKTVANPKASPITPKVSPKPTPKATQSQKASTPKITNTEVRCQKGSIKRVFVAKECPPGWKSS